MHVGPMSAEDLGEVGRAWNAALPYDEVTEARFRRVVLEDPNYEPEAVLVAKGDDGSVVGLSACVARRSVKGKDGRGGDYEFGRGFLKGFFAAEGREGEMAADRLLAAAEDYCQQAGKKQLRVTEYAGPYFWPGMDVRYERQRETLAKRGYRDVRTIEDVAVDLGDPGLRRRAERARAMLSAEIEMLDWVPELLPAMQKFVAEGQELQWFPPGWESGFSEARDTAVVLRRGGEILAWAHYWPGRPRASFGPILVLTRVRGRGYGSVLLLECMVRAREKGAEQMDAGWANTGFYTANGWHITRRFAVLTKDLMSEENS